MYHKTPISIYTAGEMTNTDNYSSGDLIDWRNKLELYLKEIPIKWNHPDNLGHSTPSEDEDIVSADMELINNSNIVIAFLNRPELYGTITEVMYAISKKIFVIVIISDDLPTKSNRHGEYIVHGNSTEFDNRHDYWFLESLLQITGNAIVIPGSLTITNQKIQLKDRLIEHLKEEKYPISEYQLYLNSDEWKKQSSIFKQGKNGICEMCNQLVGAHGLNTHHIHYPKNLKKEDNKKNWIAVCKICHNKLHGINGDGKHENL